MSLPASVGGKNDGWSFPKREFCASFSWPQELWPALSDDPFDQNTRQRQHSYGQNSLLGYDLRINTYVVGKNEEKYGMRALTDMQITLFLDFWTRSFHFRD